MAGEAVRQLVSADTDNYILEDVSINTPLVVPPGLSYGASLQGLEDITASTTQMAASASAYNDVESSSRYLLHPAVLDMGLQLNLVAMCQGLRRRCDVLLVPSFIKEIVVVAARYQEIEGKEQEMIDFSGGRLGMTAAVKWVKPGRSLEGTIKAHQGSRGEHPRFVMRDVTLSAKPRAQIHPSLESLKLVSHFDWAPDVDLNDTNYVSSTAWLIHFNKDDLL
nr:Lovastatin nonaketide synthase 3 [Colletotrichum truncatum]KAF6784836.1 Lovastatin nonaketide synthase 3 [Colletotrichum truncatum]